jgi:hypothetical protein
MSLISAFLETCSSTVIVMMVIMFFTGNVARLLAEARQ